jgi:hypothetical protein
MGQKQPPTFINNRNFKQSLIEILCGKLLQKSTYEVNTPRKRGTPLQMVVQIVLYLVD